MNFWHYFLKVIIKPNSTFDALKDDPKRLKYGLVAVFLLSSLYTITVIGLAIQNAHTAVEPFLRVSSQEYYKWQVFFIFPVMFSDLILVSGLAYLIGKLFYGKGTFDDNLAALGFAVTIPWYLTWIVETFGVVLIFLGVVSHDEWLKAISQPGFWNSFNTFYQLVPVLWYLVLVYLAIKRTQRLNLLPSIFVVIVSAIFFGLVMFVFIR